MNNYFLKTSVYCTAYVVTVYAKTLGDVVCGYVGVHVGEGCYFGLLFILIFYFWKEGEISR
jgi:hypothetical protein